MNSYTISKQPVNDLKLLSGFQTLKFVSSYIFPFCEVKYSILVSHYHIYNLRQATRGVKILKLSNKSAIFPKQYKQHHQNSEFPQTVSPEQHCL